MRHKLALSLCSARVRAEVLRPVATGLRGLLRSALGGGEAAYAPVARVELPGAPDQAALPALLDELAAKLKTRHVPGVTGLHLEVQLGLEHAHLGLMAAGDAQAAPLAAAAHASYAQAWVRQMLHLDPDTQVIRWQASADRRRLMISCVDKPVFTALQEFAGRHGLRFASCRPAVLSAVTAAAKTPRTGEPVTLVWTEAGRDAPRCGSVQLLRLERGHLAGAWRGWVPAPVDARSADSALESAIARFRAQDAAPQSAAVERIHWPSEALAA